jgi:hypothetical protein
MAVATVLMVGVEQLPLVPEYLNLGAVVVIAPDQETLSTWTFERSSTGHPSRRPDEPSTVVDMTGRRIISDGVTLPLSDLEYRVLSALLSPVGRAMSFKDLRAVGWGDSPELPADIYSVRALVQRLRAKLEVARTDVRIDAVRGFGFRAARRAEPARGRLRGV